MAIRSEPKPSAKTKTKTKSIPEAKPETDSKMGAQPAPTADKPAKKPSASSKPAAAPRKKSAPADASATPADETAAWPPIEPARPAHSGTIRVGVGGWTFPPWRENFYPEGLAQRLELAYASRHLTAIEINGTYYRTQKPESFAEWRDTVPDNFVFSVKASRYATNRKVLSEAGESIERFINSGLSELGDKLGPLLWEFARFKKFDAADFEGFLKLLPAKLGSRNLRHVMDVRHDSFKVPEFVALARKYKVAVVYTDAHDLPSFADITSDFVYARMMEAEADRPNGYPDEALDKLAAHALEWAAGSLARDLPAVEPSGAAAVLPRDVFIYMINGAKERAPAAARALLGRLG